MAPLRVPDDGLLLIGEAGESPSFPTQAFAVTLDDDVIEDLIRCFENDDEIQLSLGSNPVSPCFAFTILIWQQEPRPAMAGQEGRQGPTMARTVLVPFGH